MEYRTLELTILSAENLKKVTHFSKTAAYVVVSVVDSSYNLNSVLHKHQTPVDKHGDKNPTWNYPVSFTVNDVALQQNRITFLFQLYTKRLLPVDKLIGEVHVPVSDMISSGGDGKQEVSTTLAYQVRKSHGSPRGVLHIKCKIGEKFERVEPPPDRREPATAYPYAPPPPPHQSMWGRPAQGYYPPPQVQQAGYGYGGYGNNGYGYGYGNGGGYGNGRMGGFGGMGGGRNNFGMGLGAGLLGGALGGMLIGDMMSDAAYDGAYDGGFDGGFDDGGFDGGGFDDGGFDGGGFDF